MQFLVGLPSVDNKANINVIHSLLDQLPYIVENHHGIQCVTVTNTLIHNARNQIAKAAVEMKADYLFFLDSDCVIPVNTLKKLAEYDKDIVAGMYFQKRYPHLPVIYQMNKKGTFDIISDYPKNTLLEVGGVGMGVCLIKTSVFQKLKDNPFEPMAATTNCQAINGEDLAFCKRAIHKGFKIFVDTGIQAKHQTERYIDEAYFVNAWETMKYQEQNKLKASPQAEI